MRARPFVQRLGLLLLVHAAIAPAAGADEPPLPRRLADLARELAAGAERGPALERFWSEVAERGAPWVEPTPDRPDASYVTFLWRGAPGTRNVLLSTLEQREISNSEFLEKGRMILLPASDVWYRTYRLRNDVRFTYQFSPDDPLTLLIDLPPAEWSARRAGFRPDPFNSRRFTTRNGECSVVELSAAPAQPWLERRPGAPEGRLEERAFRSGTLDNERVLTVYTPPGYDAEKGGPYPLLVLFDGATYLGPIPTPVILDNLLAAGELPPVVAVFVESGAARIRELVPNEPFQDFLASELIPWIRDRYRAGLRPDDTVVVGLSLGGTAAAYSGLRHPEIFGNVLSQSGGFEVAAAASDPFAPRPPGELLQEDSPEHEWIAHEYATRPPTAVRFYLEVGLREEAGWRHPATPFAKPSAVAAHRHLRDVLRASGHEVHYREPNCGHEVLCWRGSLADGLVALLGDRPGPGT